MRRVKENRTAGCEIQPLDTADHTSSCRTQHANYLWWSVRTVSLFFCFFFNIWGDFMRVLICAKLCRMWHMWWILLTHPISLPRRVLGAKSQRVIEAYYVAAAVQRTTIPPLKGACMCGCRSIHSNYSRGWSKNRTAKTLQGQLIMRSKGALMSNSFSSCYSHRAKDKCQNND